MNECGKQLVIPVQTALQGYFCTMLEYVLSKFDFIHVLTHVKLLVIRRSETVLTRLVLNVAETTGTIRVLVDYERGWWKRGRFPPRELTHLSPNANVIVHVKRVRHSSVQQPNAFIFPPSGRDI